MNPSAEDYKAAVALVKELRAAERVCFQIISKSPFLVTRVHKDLQTAGVKEGFNQRADEFLKRYYKDHPEA